MPETASYKQQKEDFVSNLSGGSVAEVNVIAAVTIVRDLIFASKHQLCIP